MFFQKKVDGVFKKLHEQGEYAEKELHYLPDDNDKENMPELEKNDMLAMILSAFLVMIPAAILVMAILSVIFFIFLA